MNDFALENIFNSVGVINNEYNIGGNANILKSVIIEKSKYVWVLDDYDIPSKHAVSTIINYLKDDVDYICFSYSIFSVENDVNFSIINEMYEVQNNI